MPLQRTISKPLKVALDINSCFGPAQAYVMLSRVQELNQIFIIEKLPPGKLNPSHRALLELKEMNQRCLNINPNHWRESDTDAMKIVSLNIGRLGPHIKDLRCDQRIQQADIIHLQETWNTDTEKCNMDLDNYSSHFVNIGPGKGIATYYKNNFTHLVDIATETIQISKFTSEYIDSINVYRTQRGLPNELNEQLDKLITADKITIITGDFNICSRVKWNNRVSTHLKSLNFKQHQLGATQIRGGHIDHLYVKHDGPRQIRVVAERYSPYYSDHDGLCIILTPAIPNSDQ